MPSLASRTVWNVYAPIRMCAVEVAVRGNHLRLEPDSELDSEFIQVIVNSFDTVRELTAVNDPVSERAVVGVPFPEPAVVDDKQLYPISAQQLPIFFRRFSSKLK